MFTSFTMFVKHHPLVPSAIIIFHLCQETTYNVVYQTAILSRSNNHCHHQYHNHHHHQQRLLHIFPYFCPKFFLFTQRNFLNFLTKITLSISLTSLMLTSFTRPIIHLFHWPSSFSICVKRLPTMRCIRPRLYLRAATIVTNNIITVIIIGNASYFRLLWPNILFFFTQTQRNL